MVVMGAGTMNAECGDEMVAEARDSILEVFLVLLLLPKYKLKEITINLKKNFKWSNIIWNIFIYLRETEL